MAASRDRWEVLDAETREHLSPPYYVGAPAIKLARRLESEGRKVIVLRNGREYRWGVS